MEETDCVILGAGRHKVRYDDGETEFLLLSHEHVRWDRRPADQPNPGANPSMQPSSEHPGPEQEPLAMTNERPPPQEPSQIDAPAAEEPAPATQPEAPVEDKAAEAARLEVRIVLGSYSFPIAELFDKSSANSMGL